MLRSTSSSLSALGKSLRASSVAARTFATSFEENKYENLLVEKRDNVALITLNRPKALNALCDALLKELSDAFTKAENDPAIGSIVLTGSQKAFAAGADIKEMTPMTPSEHWQRNYFGDLDMMKAMRKPVIAVVNGYALGGGCELAMMCDMIIAGDNAKFGQPEVTIGTIPGMGGTQRLLRAVGKSKAMELCLTGRQLPAQEAESAGLVTRVVPVQESVDEGLRVAGIIARMSRVAIGMTKECVNKAEEMNLTEGLQYERRVFQSTFSTEDQKEGMTAFAEKRTPEWKHK